MGSTSPATCHRQGHYASFLCTCRSAGTILIDAHAERVILEHETDFLARDSGRLIAEFFVELPRLIVVPFNSQLDFIRSASLG